MSVQQSPRKRQKTKCSQTKMKCKNLVSGKFLGVCFNRELQILAFNKLQINRGIGIRKKYEIQKFKENIDH